MDFVLRSGKEIVPIEVKSNSDFFQSSGIDHFVEQFKPSRILLIGKGGIPLETFFATPLTRYFTGQAG